MFEWAKCMTPEFSSHFIKDIETYDLEIFWNILEDSIKKPEIDRSIKSRELLKFKKQIYATIDQIEEVFYELGASDDLCINWTNFYKLFDIPRNVSFYKRPTKTQMKNKVMYGKDKMHIHNFAAYCVALKHLGIRLDIDQVLNVVLPDLQQLKELNEYELNVYLWNVEKNKQTLHTIFIPKEKINTETILLIGANGYKYAMSSHAVIVSGPRYPKKSWAHDISYKLTQKYIENYS